MMLVVNRLEKMIAVFLKAGRAKVLIATATTLVLAALADRYVGTDISLGVLYILPMMLGAVVMRPIESAGMAILCSALRSAFDDVPGASLEMVLLRVRGL
jgi:hypothetical protein